MASPKSNNEDDDIFPMAWDIRVNVEDDKVFESAYKGGETSFSQMTMNLATQEDLLQMVHVIAQFVETSYVS